MPQGSSLVSKPPTFAVFDVSPVVECRTTWGRAVVVEIVRFDTTAFCEGQDLHGIKYFLADPYGTAVELSPISSHNGSDRYFANFTATTQGKWSFSIMARGDSLDTLRRRDGKHFTGKIRVGRRDLRVWLHIN